MRRTTPQSKDPKRHEVPFSRPGETPEQHAARLKDAVSALKELAAMGGIASIPDPAAWQREIREDRPLPGRD